MARVPSVAVLPFINIGDDPEQAYFAEGLTEDVVTDLSQLSGLLTVVHRGARDGRERPSPQEAARTLRASYVLEGSVRQLGGRVRLRWEERRVGKECVRPCRSRW